MSKFINSKEAITSPLQLWQGVPTQVSTQETYNIICHSQTNLYNEGPINFVLPPQPNGMLTSVDIVTKFSIRDGGEPITELKTDLSIINNFSNALWELVEIRVDDRLDLMQSMRNAYPYQTYFNTVLNSNTDREDYLFQNELFKMDQALDKTDAEDVNPILLDADLAASSINKKIRDATDTDITWQTAIGTKAKVTPGEGATNTEASEVTITMPQTHYYQYALNLYRELHMEQFNKDHYSVNPKNPASGERAMRINKGQSVTISSKLQCPLLTTAKCLPTNIKMRISLTKNNDNFLLMAPGPPVINKYQVVIEDIFLDVTYFRPIDMVLNQIESQLQIEPAPYFISKPEIILRSISTSNRFIRLNDIFHGKLPTTALFALQKSTDYEGKRDTNGFAFLPFGKFQIYVNGKPYFMNPLECNFTKENDKKIYSENGEFYRQLYKTIGRDFRGNALVNSKNFQLNFMVGVSFTADRSATSAGYLNLQEQGSTYLEIDMGYDEDIPQDMMLIVYALFDRQIQIDSNRNFKIIE